MQRSIKPGQEPIEQPPSSEVPPLEAEVRAADIATDDAGVGSEEAAQPDASREARIREAAYAAYLRRGGQAGHEEEDWLEAERSIDAEEDSSGRH
ncbi:MAG TPA: DUF2934 domain-containing protein [Variovorax sp.]|jgi:hypothetical protein|nr:DUF2934 domain-containing protein [Variovorax sp.]